MPLNMNYETIKAWTIFNFRNRVLFGIAQKTPKIQQMSLSTMRCLPATFGGRRVSWQSVICSIFCKLQISSRYWERRPGRPEATGKARPATVSTGHRDLKGAEKVRNCAWRERTVTPGTTGPSRWHHFGPRADQKARNSFQNWILSWQPRLG